MRTGLVVALVVIGFGIGTASAAPLCEDTGKGQKRCKGSKCKCSPLLVGDPVNMIDRNAYFRDEDLVLPAMHPVPLLRSYNSELYVANHGGGPPGYTGIASLPKPFGTIGWSMRWGHNFYTFVHLNTFGNRWVVRTPVVRAS